LLGETYDTEYTNGGRRHSQSYIVGIATRLLVGWSWFQMLVGARDFLSSQTAQTGSAAHPAFHSMGTWVLSREYSGWGVK